MRPKYHGIPSANLHSTLTNDQRNVSSNVEYSGNISLLYYA